MSKRLFLHEHITNILKADADAKREAIEKELQDRFFADFFDLVYNKNYNWEFDNKIKVNPRNKRENGGDCVSWRQVCKLVRNTILKPSIQSVNFSRRLERTLETCNYKDIKILLCMLNNRSIQYLNTKKVYEWFPQYKLKENEE